MLTARTRGCPAPGAFLLSVLVISTVMAGCTGPQDPPPIAELEPPTWEVGQEWHYKGSNDQWRNWTVVGLEERRGFETYKVRVDYSSPDKLGRTGAVLWLDRTTLGTVERQNGLNRQSTMATIGLYDFPYPPRFPFKFGETTIRGNATVVSGGEWWNFTEIEIQAIEGWDAVNTPAGVLDAVEVRTRNLETNGSSVYWYAPAVEHHARYVYVGERLTFNLTSWVVPD